MVTSNEKHNATYKKKTNNEFIFFIYKIAVKVNDILHRFPGLRGASPCHTSRS